MGETTQKKETQKKDMPKKDAPKKSFFKTFLKGIKAELKKISWPDKQSLLKQSFAVVAISIVLGLIITLLDTILQYGINFLSL